METLNEKEQEKVQYGLLLLKTQERLSTKFVKSIRDGIFELRTDKGFLWYQGESNRKDPDLYRRLQPAFVKMLREAWGQGELPFYYVRQYSQHPLRSRSLQ